jgi:hypothetical protein
VTCQTCGDDHVSPVKSGGGCRESPGPALAFPAPEKPAKGDKDDEAWPTELLAAGEIDGITVLRALKHYVETHFENVGKDFASLVRKMRDGEIPQKNIYGEATPEEKERLADDEIPHIVVPCLPPAFKN